MTLTLESTDYIVEIDTGRGCVPARVWEGTDARGTVCYALITRIAVHKDSDARTFDRDLVEHRPASARAREAFPASIRLGEVIAADTADRVDRALARRVIPAGKRTSQEPDKTPKTP